MSDKVSSYYEKTHTMLPLVENDAILLTPNNSMLLLTPLKVMSYMLLYILGIHCGGLDPVI